jgi:hypothetical protein
MLTQCRFHLLCCELHFDGFQPVSGELAPEILSLRRAPSFAAVLLWMRGHSSGVQVLPLPVVLCALALSFNATALSQLKENAGTCNQASIFAVQCTLDWQVTCSNGTLLAHPSPLPLIGEFVLVR